MLTGKEAKLAWANGEELLWRTVGGIAWKNINDHFSLSAFDSGRFEFRIKPKTIKINGVEVPSNVHVMHSGGCCVKISCKSSEDSESLARALRSIFKGE